MIEKRPEIHMIEVDQIDPQAKDFHSVRYFPQRDILGLVASIHQNGGSIDQPIGVRPTHGEGFAYEVVFGRRRLLAARYLGMTHIPARTFHVEDREAALLSLRENVSRRGPNLLQRGWAYAKLEDTGMSQVEIARAAGRKTSTVNEGVRFARALPECLLLELASEIAPDTDPSVAVFRAVRLSKRTLLAISDAARRDDHRPLRRAIEEILAGSAKGKVTQAVRNAAEGGSQRTSVEAAYRVGSRDGLCVSFSLGQSPEHLTTGDASQLLSHLAPVVQALETRANEGKDDVGASWGERARRWIWNLWTKVFGRLLGWWRSDRDVAEALPVRRMPADR